MKIQPRNSKKGEAIIMGMTLLVVGGLISCGVNALYTPQHLASCFTGKVKKVVCL